MIEAKRGVSGEVADVRDKIDKMWESRDWGREVT